MALATDPESASMFADPFQAHYDGIGASATVPFTLLSLSNNSSVRENLSASAGYPKVMKISHTDVGKGRTARRRSLLRLEAFPLVEGVEDRSAIPAALYVVADIPKVGFTDDQLHRLAYQLCGILRNAGGIDESTSNVPVGSSAGNFHRWHNGEM